MENVNPIELLMEYKKLVHEIDELNNDIEATRKAQADPFTSYQDKRELENDLVYDNTRKAAVVARKTQIEAILNELGIAFEEEEKGFPQK